ncbi:response regulator transcription factor [Gallaecimonas sp. GXIMD4217]|uniref:response regulator transcription factor n=1 Tax=Gallaecimonas sp. GXIMD4217 TaxID=3131927 RepID=UPI00311B32FE
MKPMGSCRIFVADDHPLYLDALVAGLARRFPDACLTSADNYLDLFETLSDSADDLDLLVLDLFMPGSTGYSGLYFLRRHFPELPIVVISAQDDLSSRNRCLEHGAAAFVSKSAPPEELFDLVARILDGSYRFARQQERAAGSQAYERIASLTPSQFKVLHLLAAGHANKVIADRLHISEKTVKAHVTAIFAKLQVSNRTRAALLLSEDPR